MSELAENTELAREAAAGSVTAAPAAPAAPTTSDAAEPASTAALATPQRRDGGIRASFPPMSAKLLTGLILVGGIVLFAILAPLFTQNPRSTQNGALLPPSADHLLGTTKLGNDVLAQLAHGAQGSLLIGLVAGGIAIVLSLLFGVLAGYLGGWKEDVLSLVTNVMIVIPGLPFIMVLSAMLPNRSWQMLALVLGITSWAGAAYVLRLQARSLRSRDYVYASKVAGERAGRIILVEILPNLLPLLTAQFLFAIIFAILGEAGLSYLGLGPTDSITWGTILNDAQSGQALTRGAWWWFVPPGILIAGLGCGLSLINFAIDEIINPKLRNAPKAARSVRKAAKAGAGVATGSDAGSAASGPAASGTAPTTSSNGADA